jgi:transcriptional regulator CtsR
MIFQTRSKRNSSYRFATVDYDSQLFRDYVIDTNIKAKTGFDTESAKRIGRAFDYFVKHNSDKNEQYLARMLDVIQKASCTTHLVTDESEAIQMFIFQNNRGKKPSNLEIIKAQFMFSVHLFGGEEKEALIEEIKNRFEKIYKSISAIDYQIDEDDVLLYTLKVHFNSLWESNPIEKINRLLAEINPIPFVKAFTHSLAVSFEHLTAFFGKDERESVPIHSLIALGDIGIAIPFIIKAYTFSLTNV